MNRSRTLRNRLLSPLVYLGALILLLEEWFWDVGLRLVRLIASWPALKALERHIVALPPNAALAAFVLPALLLLPVKILALLAIASGHPIAGIAAIVVAKVGGAALVARIYVLTRPTLLTLAWFERWHTRFIDTRDRWVASLKATNAYRRAGVLSAMMGSAARGAFARLRPHIKFGARSATRPARMLRRFIAIWRARRR